ncbi:hypothetical protein N7931_05625 [Catenovulum sp. 2E275]|uniref:hypothetical protein n=1 Tax=Catenovulum sp. 2E275 TaxID=2980497 RepID=UPI0021D1D6D0|nr:hypothetical protein [Catenovulum sp. 2E275]MCU4675108.1 hypothetical protein [Catenovulum sp. 2E275]
MYIDFSRYLKYFIIFAITGVIFYLNADFENQTQVTYINGVVEERRTVLRDDSPSEHLLYVRTASDKVVIVELPYSQKIVSGATVQLKVLSKSGSKPQYVFNKYVQN